MESESGESGSESGEEEEYTVERIIAKRMNEGKEEQYLIKWDGWDDNANTWEPTAHLEHCPEMLKLYDTRISSRKKFEKEVNDMSFFCFEMIERS